MLTRGDVTAIADLIMGYKCTRVLGWSQDTHRHMMRKKCVAADAHDPSWTHWSLFVPSSDKATHPTNRQEDWEYIIGFCDQINKELEGYVYVYMLKMFCMLCQHWVMSLCFVRQSSNCCHPARTQDPLPARMGSSAGSNSKDNTLNVQFNNSI